MSQSTTPSLFDRVADALGSRTLLAFYCGCYVGALLTAVLALIWAKVGL